MREGTTSQSQPEETQVPIVMNLEMWVQLTVEQHQKTSRLLEEQQQQTAFLLNTVQKLQEEMIRVRRDNERLLQDQEKILKSLSDKQNQEMRHPSDEKELSMEPKDQKTRNNTTGRTEKSLSQKSKNKNYNEAESGNLSDQQDLKRQKVELQGEFRKIKPPTFDGEAEEAAEAWLININNYFQLYEYSSNLKARLAIYQLREKATLWWEEVKNVRSIDERDITWELFQQYSKDIYLTEIFYDDKAKEFHDLWLGQMTMDDYVTKFTSLLRYVPYL